MRGCRRWLAVVVLLGVVVAGVDPRLSSCPLFWDSRQSLGFDQGVQLQVCCNITRAKIWEFASAANFTLASVPRVDQEVPTTTQDVWSELQLSLCSDRQKPTIGWVEGKPPGITCQYRIGQTLNLPPSILPLPQWYVLCYQQQDGCEACRLDAVCDNDLSQECADNYLLGSSPSATNHSIRYWIAVGKNFPFERNSHVELTVRVQRTGKLVKVEKLTPFAGKKQTVDLTGLAPNEVYNVERCMVISLAPSLLDHPSMAFVSNTSRLCVEEGYRTLPNASSQTNIFATFWISFLVFACHLLR